MSSFQYILVVCETPERRQLFLAEAAAWSSWNHHLLGNKSALFITDDRHFLSFARHSGAVIGDLFQRAGSMAPVAALDAELVGDASRLCDHLSQHYWGTYISYVERDDRVTVGRDPSGMLPCFYVRIAGAILLASDARLLFLATGLAASISWHDIARTLYTKNLPTSSTCLDGVSELLPGTAMTVRNNRIAIEPFWSPWDHVSERKGVDDAAHVIAVRESVFRCVSSLTQRHGTVLVGASGGLDSSIVLASLVEGGCAPSGLTMVTDDPIGDERHYAADLCHHLGIPLLSARYNLDDIDIDRSSVAHHPRPCGRTEAMAYDAAVHRVMAQRSFSMFVSGSGGDNVFFLSRSARAVADTWIARGSGRETWRTANDVARLTGVSLARVGREAARFLPKRHRRYDWSPLDRFLHPDVAAREDNSPILHPWLDAPADALPGKAAHIALLLRLQPFVACYDRASEFPVLSPLAAQPVMEACLAVPTWLSCRNGHDRSVARAAFASQLPASIAWRRSKGGPDGFAIQLLTHHLTAVRERLLGGRLVAARLLDIPELDRALSPAALARDRDYPRILSLLDTEAWARSRPGSSSTATERTEPTAALASGVRPTSAAARTASRSGRKPVP